MPLMEFCLRLGNLLARRANFFTFAQQLLELL
jgi:hypothetical protein